MRLLALIIEVENPSLVGRVPLDQLIVYWSTQLGLLALACAVLGGIYSTFKHRSLILGVRNTAKGVAEGARDILLLPLGYRRVWAIARLSFMEAIRKRVLYVLVMFLPLFLFAGWYLPNAAEGQLMFLVAFVFNAMTWILLPMVLFLTAMSLPADIKSKTIQTVVTKPVRRLEIVVGRILGYTAIFTLVLAVMGGVSLLYLRGQVAPEVREKQWTARVPIYASGDADVLRPLVFYKNNVPQIAGTNVGKEWGYRSHIEGTDTAHWYFTVDPTVFAGRPTARCEFTFDIFKTTKGDPSRPGAEGAGVLAYLEFKDRTTGQVLHSRYHRVDNHRVNVLDGIPTEVFKNGKCEVVAQCITPEQFLGMAPADLYFLAGTRSFEQNFLKGLFSIWLKVVLFTCIAVAASTVLNAFVTVLFVLTVYLLGVFYDFMVAVVKQDVAGGGPIEALIRLVTQDNQLTLLDPTLFNRVATSIDRVLLGMMERLTYIVPNLSTLDMTTPFVAEGYDVPSALLLRNAIIVVSYVIPVVLAGYFLLKNREIAA